MSCNFFTVSSFRGAKKIKEDKLSTKFSSFTNLVASLENWKKCNVLYSYQGWELAHLLRSLKSNEPLWAICSDRSGQMSDCERIAQVAQVKRATVSKSLRSLMINERSLKKIWLKSCFLYVKNIKNRAIRSFHLFYWAMWANCSGPSPKMSNHERFAHVAHQKRATKSKSLRSLTKNERITCFFRSFFRKNKRFAQKTDERIPSPDSYYCSYSSVFTEGNGFISAFYLDPDPLRGGRLT